MDTLSFADFEQGARLGKEEYQRLGAALRVDLLNAQFDLLSSERNLLILIAGDDRDGCHELIDLLHEWLDARRLRTHVFLGTSEEERRHPPFWRYWNALPPRGHIGILLGAWVYDAIEGRLGDELSKKGFARLAAHGSRFETTLAADGTTLVKLWVHSAKSILEERLDEANGRRHGWRAAKRNRRFVELHEELVELGESLVAATHTPQAPWHVIEGTDREQRDVSAARVVLDALRAQAPHVERVEMPELAPEAPSLARLDLSVSLPRKEYEQRLDAAQARLSDLTIEASERGLASVLVFEGQDAAGKGGTIRRMTRAMAAPVYRVLPVAAPSEEERRHHWLWRFWRGLGPAGCMTIFDRSWYGRVLVERVEGFAQEHEWQRAYAEIREFEEQLTESGVVLAKFWLQVDRDEQLRRFEARERTPYKKYKIGAEDYRNRARWDEYALAAEEMFARTHAEAAPWHVLASNDKRHARVQAIETVCEALERAL